MARLTQIVFDCERPAALARFWAAALDDFAVRAYDQDEIDRLAALGFTPETDPIVLVDGPNLEICFQQTDVDSTGKRRLHMDIATDDRPAEVARLVELGASVRERFDGHTWMLDPEGNDFCITDDD